MPSNVHTMAEFADAFELGLTRVYRDELKRIPVEYRSVIREKPAKHFYDTEWVVSGLGTMPTKAVGGEIEVDKIISGPTKRHGMQPYALALVIVYEAIRWDLHSIFAPLARSLPKSATDRYNLVAYDFYENAFNSSASAKYLNYQGEAPCSTSHQSLDGSTWSNRLAGNDALSYEAIQEAEVLLTRTTNDRGQYVQIRAKHLICAVEQKWIAKTILMSDKRPGTANNDMNTLSSDGLSIHTSVFLTTPEYWFLQCSKNEPGFQVCMRMGDSPDLVRDSDSRTRNRIMTSYCSFEFANFQDRGLVGSSGGA